MVKLPDRALLELACGVPDAKPAQPGTLPAEASPQSYQIAGARRPQLLVAFLQYARVPQLYAFRYKPTDTIVLARTCALLVPRQAGAQRVSQPPAPAGGAVNAGDKS